MTSVAVLSRGVGGPNAVHELAERGFDVTVYEAREAFGGKARSVPGSGTGGRADLPAEHGFRFFPRRHEVATAWGGERPGRDASAERDDATWRRCSGQSHVEQRLGG